MKKAALFGAVATAAVMFAGAASAQHVLQYRATGPVGAITSADVNSATGPGNAVAADQDQAKYGRSLVGLYLIAEEALGSNLGSGVLALSDTLSTGSIPSGNSLYTVSLSNATFGTAVTTAIISGTNCTAVLSSGGTAASSSVTFLVSSSGGGSCSSFNIDLPVRPTAAGTVSVSTNLRTEQGNPIDGGVSTLEAIYAIDAFQPAFNSTLTSAGAGVDTFTPIGSGTPYTTLSGDNNLGKLAVYVDARAQRDLEPGNFVEVGDVTNATVTVAGDFNAFNEDTAPQLTTGSGPAPVVTGTVATNAQSVTFANAAANITQLLSSKPNGSSVTVTPDGDMIPASDYRATIAYTLESTIYSPQSPQTGDLESIQREGVSFIAPWVGGSQAVSQSVIRLSSTGAATGQVTLVLTNALSSTGAVADATCAIGSVPATGDLIINTERMNQCFGNFIRGDLLITVEGAPNTLTAKMRNANASGNFETTLGRYSGSTAAGAAQ